MCLADEGNRGKHGVFDGFCLPCPETVSIRGGRLTWAWEAEEAPDFAIGAPATMDLGMMHERTEGGNETVWGKIPKGLSLVSERWLG
jgi:hypothetical protein